ncbi:MAG: hypothetical protein AB7E09_07545 [Candidatus Izemoplasmatales bacterium]
MNNKDLKNRIKESAINEIPDVFDKINIQDITIEPRTETVKKPQFSFNLKLVLSTFLFIITGFFIYQTIQSPETDLPYLSDVESLAFQTVSAQSLLEYTNIENQSLSMSAADDVEDYLDEMTPMIELAEMIVNQRNQISYQVLESDRQDYDYRIHFKAYSLNQVLIEYDVYYNQSNENITGLVFTGESDYQFVKNSDRFRLYENDQDFIEINNQKPNLFNFRYMKNNLEQFSTQIDLDYQNDAYQANFNYQNKQGLQISLMMKRNPNQSMEVDYSVRDMARQMNGRYQVSVEENQDTGQPIYRFKFDDQSIIEKEKPNRPHQNNPGRGPGNMSLNIF